MSRPLDKGHEPLRRKLDKLDPKMYVMLVSYFMDANYEGMHPLPSKVLDTGICLIWNVFYWAVMVNKINCPQCWQLLPNTPA